MPKTIQIGHSSHEVAEPLGTCFWCPNPARTRDHLVPRWVFKRLPKHMRRSLPRQIEPSCATCNRDKGGMPPTVFRVVRLDFEKRKAAHREWAIISERMKFEQSQEDIALVLAAMCQVVVGIPRHDPEYVAHPVYHQRYAMFKKK